MKIIASILLLMVFSCTHRNRDNIKAEHVEFYDGTKIVATRFKTLNGQLIDTFFYYDSFGTVSAKHIYSNNHKLIEELMYEKGLILFKIDSLGMVSKYKKAILYSVFNPKDSSYTYFFKNGFIKKFEKRCHGSVVYSNEYDSLSHKPKKFYRYTEEHINVIKDTIIINPYFPCKTLHIKDFKYSIIIKNQGVERTYTQQNNDPVFKFKIKSGMEWTKTICDSIGCFSVPVQFGD